MKQCPRCQYTLPLDHFYTMRSGRSAGRPGSYCKLCTNKNSTEWYRQNPERAMRTVRRYQFKKKYGITPEQYDEMLDNQNGVCYLCNRAETIAGESLRVDHCHTTGRVRGLLCHHCNTGLGMFHDDPVLLRRAASYVEEHAWRSSSES